MVARFPFEVLFQGIDRLSGPMGGIQTRLKKFGKLADQVGRKMTTRLSLPILAFGALTARTGIQYETSMNRVAALSQASGEEMGLLRNEAKKLGLQTAFSAGQAGEGMVFLKQAGFDVKELLQATGPVLDLAASGLADVGESADILTDVLKGFGKEAGESTRVADLLAGGVTSVTTNMQDFAEGLSRVAPFSASLQQPMEDTATLMAALSDAGLKGSLGGNILKRMLVQLLAPSRDAKKALFQLGIPVDKIRNTTGGMRSMLEIVDLLGKSGANVDQLLALFGPRTIVGAAALVNLGGDALRSLRTDVSELGIAHRVATDQMKGLPGEVRRLMASFEGLQLALLDAGLAEGMEELAIHTRGLLFEASQANPELLKQVLIFGGILAIAGPLLIGLGGLATGLAGVAVVAKVVLIPVALFVVKVFGMLLAGVIALGAPIAILVGGFVALTVLFGKFLRDVPILGTVFSKVWDGIAAGFKWVFGLITRGMKKLLKIVPDFIKDKLGLEGPLLPDFGPPAEPLRTERGAAALATAAVAPGPQSAMGLIRLQLEADPKFAELFRMLEKDSEGLPPDVDLGGTLLAPG